MSRCLKVEPGEVFEVETFDASNGYIRPSRTRRSRRLRPGFDRCRRRPIRSPGRSGSRAPSGATRWSSRSRRSWSTIIPGSRSARGAARWASRRDGPSSRATTRRRSSATRPAPAARRATARCTSTTERSWPITPFVGTLGVAPDREVTTSIDGQGEWGGNLDIRDVAPGNRIMLPDLPPGALLLPGRRPRQPGRHRVHRHGRRDHGDRAAAARAEEGIPRSRACGSRSPRAWSPSTPTGRSTTPSRPRRST